MATMFRLQLSPLLARGSPRCSFAPSRPTKLPRTLLLLPRRQLMVARRPSTLEVLRRLLIRPHYHRSRNLSRPERPNPILAPVYRLPPRTLIFVIAGINVALFLLWRYSLALIDQYRDSSLYFSLRRHLLCSWDNLSHWRLHTLITSCFSHLDAGHLGVNMLSLYFFSMSVAQMVGTRYFLALYATCGVAGNLCSLAFEKLMPGSMPTARTGASGAIMGSLGFLASAAPQTTVMLYFVLPIPVWAAAGGLIAWEFWGAVSSKRGVRGGVVDSAGHLGGLIGGVLFHRRRLFRI